MRKDLSRREKRHYRMRKNLSGTDECPRLNVFRSNKHVYAQVIDDDKRHTILSVSDIEKELKSRVKGKTKTERAQEVGNLVASRVLKKGVKKVVFDRGGHKYHGRVKALAEKVREGGLKF